MKKIFNCFEKAYNADAYYPNPIQKHTIEVFANESAENLDAIKATMSNLYAEGCKDMLLCCLGTAVIVGTAVYVFNAIRD